MRFLVTLLAGVAMFTCAVRHERPAAAKRPKPGVARAAASRPPYVDRVHGFQVTPPDRGWALQANAYTTDDGERVPLVLRDDRTGAQVVIQVAPAVATPTQYAQRLTRGMRDHPGFEAGDPAPIPLSDHAVGFDFDMARRVHGKVAVREGARGDVLMMMATWPIDAPSAEADESRIFATLRPVPRG